MKNASPFMTLIVLGLSGLSGCSTTEIPPNDEGLNFLESVGSTELLFNEIDEAQEDFGRTPFDYVPPTSGTVNYVGFLGMNLSSAVVGAAEDQLLVGNLDLTIEFDPTPDDYIHGTVTDIQDADTLYTGTLLIDGDGLTKPFGGLGFSADLTGSYVGPDGRVNIVDGQLVGDLIAPGGGDVQFVQGDVLGTVTTGSDAFFIDGGFAAAQVN